MATMDDMGVDTTPEGEDMPPGDGPLGPRRRRAREILSSQYRYLDQLEDQLGEQFRQLSEQLVGTLTRPAADAQAAHRIEQVEALGQQLSDRQAELSRLRAELEQARINANLLAQEVRVHEALALEAQSEDERKRVALAQARERAADAEAELAVARQRGDELRKELAEQANLFLARQDRTRAQRRRLVSKFKNLQAEHASAFQDKLDKQHEELARQAAARQAEAERRLAEQAADFQRRYDTLASELEQSRRLRTVDADASRAAGASEAERHCEQEAEIKALLARSGAETEQLRATVAQLQTELEQSKFEASELQAQLERAKTDGPTRAKDLLAAKELDGQVQTLRDERDALAKKVAALEAGGRNRPSDADTRKKEELQRRLEMAVEDLREAKRINVELESKLKRPRSEGSVSGGGLDWEAQKEKLLASLEADDRDDTESIEERNTIEGTIRITDEIVAQKDRELAELRLRLQTQTNVDDAAAADLLDHDELVRTEREKLQQIEREWREKIGKAEIDISVERAKLARERIELDEKMRLLQAEQARRPVDGGVGPPEKPQRGRWLTRLGLKEIDEKP